MTFIAQTEPANATPAPGKRSRAEAATLAAAHFNPNRKSLFDSARVNGAQLKQALRDALQRVVLATPGIAPGSDVRVIFAGTGAYVRHEWRTVNATTKALTLSAAIFLPDVDDTAAVPRALADEMLAMALHECAHAFYTNASAFQRGIMSLAQVHGIAPELAKDVINAIEDVRIERALMRSGYASGFRGIVGALLGRIMAEAKADGCLNAFAANDATAWGFAFAYGARGYVPGADCIVPALAPKMRAAYALAEKALRDVPADSHGTRRVVDIADKVFALLALQPGEQGGEGGEGTEPGGEPQPGDKGEPGGEQGGDKQPGEPGADATEPGENGPQGDAGDADGETDAEAGEGATGGEPGEPGDADGEPDADGESGADNSAPPTGDSATGEGKAPAPGTFKSEPVIMDIPDACQPTTAPQIFTPKVRAPQPVDSGRAKAEHAKATQGFTKSGVLVANMRRLFSRSDRDALDTGKRTGRIRVGALHRVATGAETVFARRTLNDGANAACSILIDGSGSMGRLAETANRAALLIVDALAKCPGVRTECQVFQDGGGNEIVNGLITQCANEAGINVRNAEFDLHTFKRFNDSPATMYSNARPIAAGSTPDLEALAHVGRALAKRSEPRKVLLCVVDGGTGRYDAIARECKHLERAGVITVAIGLHFDPHGFPHAVRVDDMSALAGVAMRKACEAIARRFVE